MQRAAFDLAPEQLNCAAKNRVEHQPHSQNLAVEAAVPAHHEQENEESELTDGFVELRGMNGQRMSMLANPVADSHRAGNGLMVDLTGGFHHPASLGRRRLRLIGQRGGPGELAEDRLGFVYPREMHAEAKTLWGDASPATSGGEASQSSERLSQGDGGHRHIGQPEKIDVVAMGIDEGGDHRADQPPIEHQASSEL